MTRLITIFAILALTVSSTLADWPQWRGPHGTGVAEANDLPITWDEETNVAWRIDLPAWSGSSPIISGDRVYVMSPSLQPVEEEKPINEDEPQRRRRRGAVGTIMGPGGNEIMLFSIDRKNGSIIWQSKVDSGNWMRNKHNSSSPSPITDGQMIWATSGNGVVTAFDLSGNKKWSFDIQRSYGQFGLGFGYASSPILHDSKLVLQVLHGRRTDDPSYLLALDAKTGKALWREERPTDARDESPDAYTTPALLMHNGAVQIVVLGGDYVTGHDLSSGAELWRSSGINPYRESNYRIISSPVVADGMIFAPTRKTPLIALKAGGEGDITKSHFAWKWDQPGSPDVPTPLSAGGYFYMLDDQGQLTCVDAKSGNSLWGPEETGIGRTSASPILADGKIYAVSETGDVAVIKAGPKFELLGNNKLEGGYTLSTPAASGNQLFFRTAKYLYCISKP